MASYIIAGKADDPSFARAEYAAKQIEAACPNIFFKFEMKHPDYWKEFITSIFRKYDFDCYSDDFAGPLIWTHEGSLVGGSAEFVQQVCIEKFGIKDPPAVTDPMFKQIAQDNLKQVRLQQHKDTHGPPFAEKCEAACSRAQTAGLIQARAFDERRRLVVGSASMEIWSSSSLDSERSTLRELYGEGQPSQIDSGLRVGPIGEGQSHMVLLHPEPLSRKHLVLVPNRHVREVAAEDTETGTGASSRLEVPAHTFRTEVDDDLSGEDFFAAMDVLTSIGGIATWSGLRTGSEYRHPLDTHLQVLPFPLHSAGADSPLRYPLELHIESTMRKGETTVKAFAFKHVLSPVTVPEGDSRGKADIAKAALRAYNASRAELGGASTSCAVAFTTTWLLIMPISPPDVSSARHEAWLRMPPPPPCSLCGVVVSPALSKGFPETASSSMTADAPLVSTRAELEGIPEGTPEFEAACRDVRIATRILNAPAEIVGIWGLK